MKIENNFGKYAINSICDIYMYVSKQLQYKQENSVIICVSIIMFSCSAAFPCLWVCNCVYIYIYMVVSVVKDQTKAEELLCVFMRNRGLLKSLIMSAEYWWFCYINRHKRHKITQLQHTTNKRCIHCGGADTHIFICIFANVLECVYIMAFVIVAQNFVELNC